MLRSYLKVVFCFKRTRGATWRAWPLGALAIIFILSGADVFPGPSATVEDDWKLPAFEMTTLDGQTVSAADLRGDVVILDFWAIWCTPCLDDLPDVQRLHARYKETPEVTVLTMHTGWNDDAYENPNEAIQGFMAEHEYTFTVARDEEGAFTSQVAGSIPEMYVVDGVGMVRYEPEASFDVVVENVESLLN